MIFKLFGVIALSVILATSSVFAQDNSITSPTPGQVIAAGSNFEIQWLPTNSTGDISLDLGTGDSADIQIVMNIATDIPNSGSFQWAVSDSVPSGTDYTIKISAGTDINFSGRFTITSAVTSTSSTSSTSTSFSSSSSSTTTSSSSPTTTSSSSTATSSTAASTSPVASGSAQSISTALLSTTLSESLSPTTTINGQNKNSHSLSSAAIGGIVGGILGSLLLISAIVIFCLLRRRSHPALTPVDQSADTRVDAFEQGDEADYGRNAQKSTPDVQIDHRLGDANEDIVDGEL